MSLKKINIVVAGATGYVGLDLVLLLSKHPSVKVVNLCAQKNIGKNIKFFDKRIKKKLPKITDLNKVIWKNIDLLFLSLPSGKAQKIVKKLYSKYNNLKFIDLSADFRINSAKSYKEWYKLNHRAKNLTKYAKYSISEFSKRDIINYRIISNPGCYPTSIQLALIPLLKKKLIKSNNILIDSKSGYSGAGKSFAQKFKYKNLYNAIHAYGVNKHRHMSEMDQEFKKIDNKTNFTFNPHIIPTFRGLLSAIYVEKNNNISISKIKKTLINAHRKNIFVKILELNKQNGTGNVLNTNKCEISICETRIKNRIVIFSAIDNLVKGASGQAIQNMNILYKFKENTGLK